LVFHKTNGRKNWLSVFPAREYTLSAPINTIQKPGAADAMEGN